MQKLINITGVRLQRTFFKLKKIEIMKTYIIQQKETGTLIDEFISLIQAEEALREYEQMDKNEGVYTPDFYEIIENN